MSIMFDFGTQQSQSSSLHLCVLEILYLHLQGLFTILAVILALPVLLTPHVLLLYY